MCLPAHGLRTDTNLFCLDASACGFHVLLLHQLCPLHGLLLLLGERLHVLLIVLEQVLHTHHHSTSHNSRTSNRKHISACSKTLSGYDKSSLVSKAFYFINLHHPFKNIFYWFTRILSTWLSGCYNCLPSLLLSFHFFHIYLKVNNGLTPTPVNRKDVLTSNISFRTSIL